MVIMMFIAKCTVQMGTNIGPARPSVLVVISVGSQNRIAIPEELLVNMGTVKGRSWLP